MAAWNESTLAFSDHDAMRHKSGLMNNTKARVSKTDLVASKMFGKNRGKAGKDLKIGKMFKKKGKGVSTKPVSARQIGSTSIAPTLEGMDDMLQKMTKSSKGGGKKSMFSRKQFG